ncbi:MAG TPA: hypothetical protein VM600_07530 [Actinomycetota bacterium]|nr:hypothetical protein [Actinomycetota bacterium]
MPDVSSKLTATGLWSAVHTFDAQVGTPTLATLQAYGSVLMFTNFPLASPAALGDVLASYVDSGGRLVLATFVNQCGAPWGLQGRIMTAGYSPLGCGNNTSGTSRTLVADVPSSPYLSGVSSFNGGTSSFLVTGSLTSGASLVAHWSGAGNFPLVATKVTNNQTVVALNFFPPSDAARSDFWVATTDGVALMSNALRHLDLSFTSTPPAATNQTTATFEFSSEPGASFTCLLDGVPAACTSPKTYGGLSNGPHTLQVQASKFGRTNSAIHSWTVDTVAPALTTSTACATPGTTGWCRSSSYTYTLSASDSGTGLASGSPSCTRNGAAAACAGTVSSQGTHILAISAKDNAGNTSSASVSLGIDSGSPAATSTSTCGTPGSAGWCRSSVTVVGSATDAVSGVASLACTIDGASSPCSTNVADQGTHVASTTATDVAGNSSTASSTFKIDSIAPSVVLLSMTPSANAAGWHKSSVTANWACSDTGSGVTSAFASATVAAEGASQPLVGTCTDIAGNAGTDNRSVNIDLTKPTATIDPPALPFVVGLLGGVVTGSAADNLSGAAQVSVTFTNASTGAAFTRLATCTGCGSPSATWSVGTGALTPGTYVVTATTTDVADNVGNPSDPVQIIVI